MNYENWKTIITHLFVLCGIRKMSDKEHALYIADMYSELKNYFDDQQIGLAARTIAETENLYGSYPPLSVWMKYCPVRRAEVIASNVQSADFMAEIDCLIYTDGLYFDMDYTRKNIWQKFGERGRIVVSQFGGCAAIRAQGYQASQFEQERLRREIRTAWNESATDIQTGALQIASANVPAQLTRVK